MYSVGRSKAGTLGARALTVARVASKSGTAARSRPFICASSLVVGTDAMPPGTMVVGCVVRPPMSEPHSCASRLRRSAHATTSPCVSTSGNTDGAPSKSGAARR